MKAVGITTAVGARITSRGNLRRIPTIANLAMGEEML